MMKLGLSSAILARHIAVVQRQHATLTMHRRQVVSRPEPSELVRGGAIIVIDASASRLTLA
jgi:hypothetical protein